MMEPAMPSKAHFQKPRWYSPGIMNSAKPPMMAPTMMELRRGNRRFFEGAHQLAHFLIVYEIADLCFQFYPAGAKRVQRNRTITATISDIMNPAG